MEKWGILWRKKHLHDPRASITEEESSLRKRKGVLVLVPLLLQLPYWYETIVGDRIWLSGWDDLFDLDPVACMFFAGVVALPLLLIKVNKMDISEEEIRNEEIEKEIKNSLPNRSNVGAGSDDKIAKLEKIAEMKDKGIIDDDEFQQLKKEILGK